jgi:hypothetical protein
MAILHTGRGATEKTNIRLSSAMPDGIREGFLTDTYPCRLLRRRSKWIVEGVWFELGKERRRERKSRALNERGRARVHALRFQP